MNKFVKFLLIVIIIIYGIPLLIGRYYEIVPVIPFIPIFGIEHHNGDIKIRTYKRDYTIYRFTPSKIGNYDKLHKWCPVGKWRYFHHNHRIKREGYYDNCEKNGKWFDYDDDGSLWKITNYNGDKNWVSTGYYVDGNIRFIENYQDDKKEGEWVYYYENGRVQKVENYKNGNRNGKIISYYENGNIEEVGYYKDGEICGTRDSYFGNGQIHRKVSAIDCDRVCKYYENDCDYSKIRSINSFVEYDQNGEIVTKWNGISINPGSIKIYLGDTVFVY